MKTLNNFLFQDRDLAHDVYLRSLHRITQVYLILMLLVFPFYSTNCYFHILRDRRNFFLCVTGVYLSGLLLTLLCRIPREERGVIRQRCRLMKTDWLLLIFLCSATAGMALSGNAKAVFLGTDGRYQGLLMWALYGITYFCVSRFWHMNLVPIHLFLLGGVISSVWGITDFFGMDIFGWLSRVKPEQQTMFSSSYGNINTYTAAILLVAGVSAGMTVFAGAMPRKGADGTRSCHNASFRVLYPAVFLISVLALIYGRSDNAALGLMMLFLILPYWSWRTSGGSQAYCMLLECVVVALSCSGLSLSACPDLPVDVTGSILLNLSQFHSYYSLPILLCLTFLMYWSSRHEDGSWKYGSLCVRIFYCLIACLALTGAGLIAMAFAGRDFSSVPMIGRYFVMTDAWGAHRGYIWRAALEEYRHLNWLQKCFGTGLETFGNLMRSTRYEDMIRSTGVFFDSPHNEFLQYLVTAGLLGCCALFIWVFSCCARVLRSGKNGISSACAAGILAYFAASFVNISVPITQAIVIVLMGMMMASYVDAEEKASSRRFS